MRLHLSIQRHGLPVTRILWTTAPPSLAEQHARNHSSIVPVPASGIASSRAPNALYATGGYTIAQLLEDVNEVVPLETEPAMFDSEYSGQWGLEDYVVEVCGSECLHFMEVEGLLRDGDEVLVRALQISDLRARRLTGRHQISADGRHLIDGVPFGKPFLKRPTSSRPAITIPPRKKRRTSFATWDNMTNYGDEDTEWAPPPPPPVPSVKDISTLPLKETNLDEYEAVGQDDDFEDYHETHEDTGDGTVIRHTIDELEDQASESDSDASDIGDVDLTEELKGLKADMVNVSPMPGSDIVADDPLSLMGYPLRARQSTTTAKPRKSSLAQHVDKSALDEGSRRDSKVVRFGKQGLPASLVTEAAVEPMQSSGDSSDNESTGSSSTSDSNDSGSDESNSDSASDSDSDSSSDSDSNSSSSDSGSDSSSASESEDEEISTLSAKLNPPGQGSARTKKSNQRTKMRRRLSKLKELGRLPPQADFSALRDWEAGNGEWYDSSQPPTSLKDQEKAEFEAKRQQLLRDLESGGVDVSTVSEKENVPPAPPKKTEEYADKSEAPADDDPEEPAPKRRTLDIASSRRLLFGSLGVRTPRSKEDEEVTRKKLAGKVTTFVPRTVARKEPTTPAEQDAPETDLDENWEEKLDLRATECMHDDIELSTPPFPFYQHWDTEASNIIRARKGRGKKRKRKDRIQVYDGDYDQYAEEDSHIDYDNSMLLDNVAEDLENTEQFPEELDEDLPLLPSDLTSVAELAEADLKKESIIAFKILDMSKDTNWQPMVSDYRVAKVHDILDGNVLTLRLAKRDRKCPRDIEDEEEEQDGRLYSGFEMPGYEDEGEDDGFRELPFVDLIEPKLLRTSDVAEVGEASEASIPPVGSAQQNAVPAEAEVACDEFHDQQTTPGPSASRDSQDQHGSAVPQTDGTAELNGFRDKHMKEPSPAIKTPEFTGFHSSSDDDSSESEPESSSDASQDDSDAEGAEEKEAAASTSPIPHPGQVLEKGSPELKLDDNMQPLSSPGSAISIHQMIRHHFRGTSNSSARDSSESAQSVVPNPFYEIEKSYEERRLRRRESTRAKSFGQKDGDTTMDFLSAAEFLSSPTSSPQWVDLPKEEAEEAGEEEEEVVRDSVPQLPPPSQLYSDFIDLTQDSPVGSPGGCDKNSPSLPRGSGWVQKKPPPTRRQTRQSTGARVQTLQEVSISSPKQKKKGKARRGSSG
ncbi:hypothetical protein FE257_011447 [Aspergillus nanangensis]|uniref:DUF7357 domain-containing protein n=1 Tax=Aspergillus nanangensis TaxID=2582783 RepID=A0AAD4CH66_ASPNN|nr:hypothetical protein FE257_011447 [Aspergillus nanangensis]